MSYLIDDVARVLASPLPRRKAFRLLGGIMAGAFMGTVGAHRAMAANSICCSNGTGCSNNGGNCGGDASSRDATCCSTCCCASGTCSSTASSGNRNAQTGLCNFAC